MPDLYYLLKLLHILGAAPDLDVAFKTESERNLARDFMDMIAAVETK